MSQSQARLEPYTKLTLPNVIALLRDLRTSQFALKERLQNQKLAGGMPFVAHKQMLETMTRHTDALGNAIEMLIHKGNAEDWIDKIAAALGTDERAEGLVAVAAAAHKAEQELAAVEIICGCCGEPWAEGKTCGQKNNGWPFPTCYPVKALRSDAGSP